MTGPITGPLEVEIARLGAQGDGVVDGGEHGARFVPFALPGERWRIDADRAERITSSPDRRDAPCRHFGVCGGCVAQHMGDALYERWKQGMVTEAFAHRGIAVPAPPLVRIGHGARRRAVLGAAMKGGRVLLGLREEGRHRLVDLEECLVLDDRIVASLPGLRRIAALLLAEDGSARVTVTCLDAGLDVDIEAGAGVIPAEKAARLAELATAAALVRLTIDRDTVAMRATPVLTVGRAPVELPPGVFVQASAAAETALAALVTDAVGKAKRVVDLFCGVGTFTFPLARRAEVLAADGDKRAIAALQHAAKRVQGVRRIEAKVRDLFREPLSRKELEGADAVVFDPPRAGAEAQARMIAKSLVPVAVAVSCNPATLARDARILLDGGYELIRLTAVDQFVYAGHVEAVAVFNRPRRR